MPKSSEYKVSLSELLDHATILNKSITWKKSQAGMFYGYVDEYVQDMFVRYISLGHKSMPIQNIEPQYIHSYNEHLLY